MTATPPEPDFSPQPGSGLPHEPPTVLTPAYQPPAFPSPPASPPQAHQPPPAFPPQAYQPPPAFPPPPPFPTPAYEPQAYQPPAYEPPAYQPSALPPPPDPSPQDLLGPPRPRKRGPVRIIAGVIWAVIAVICAVGAVGEWMIGLHAAAVLCLVIAVGSGWYDYRVWTFKTRRLIV